MPQLHFYVPEDLAEQIKARAAKAKQPVSRYIAELVRRDVCQGWPTNYFDQISSASNETAITYEPPGLPEERLPLE